MSRELDLQWYEIRDSLLGQNLQKQDIAHALCLARDCKHPQAIHLCKLLDGFTIINNYDLQNVFEKYPNDAMALCFLALIKSKVDKNLVSRAAEMGYAFAQSCLCSLFKLTDVSSMQKKKYNTANAVVKQRERDGYFELGRCYCFAIGCVKSKKKAFKNFLIAAKLNHVESMLFSSDLMSGSETQKFYWLYVAAKSVSDREVHWGIRVRLRYRSINLPLSSIYWIGKIWFLFLSEYSSEMKSSDFDAVAFYKKQNAAAKQAVDTWCLLALRKNAFVNRDIRKKIGMMIWEQRHQGEYLN